MPASDRQPEDRAAWVRAYELVQDVQSGVPSAIAELEELLGRAEAHGWQAAARVCVFGRAVHAWVAREKVAAERIDELIDLSRRDYDDVMLATGLCLKAAFVPGDDGIVGSPESDRDLAEAFVILDHAKGEALDMITAHTACGIALYVRSLWELCDEQWAAALRYEDRTQERIGSTLLWAAAFDRLEAQTAWASNLRQLGDEEGLVQRWAAWQKLLPDASRFDAPEQWETERVALSLLMAATCGSDVRPEAQRVLGRLEADAREEPRATMHLTLALALSAHISGDAGARAEAERAIRRIDPELFPDQYELALFVAAEIEAEGGAGAGLRYARRQVQRRWDHRLARLGSVRSRIDAARMQPELDRLSWEARSDDLTGISNRRALAEYIDELRRQDGEVAVIMIDVDKFKTINDGHSHDVGDAVLTRVARILDMSVRPVDLAVRMGGDEFLVAMADTDLAAASRRATWIRRSVENQPWSDISPGLHVTASIGTAWGRASDVDAVRAVADRAVYRAKGMGGNRVVTA